MKTHFFGSCSGLLRIGFGKMGFFPKDDRTTVEGFWENFIKVSASLYASAPLIVLQFNFI
ncbi:hypothetical protein [Chryseobacterium mucoviscidosis]|uniref:hypothetical protein n=1 Tax=Chryseobacterium mucoviscidosis TaxID=1945581 RepID=UPI0031DD8CCE